MNPDRAEALAPKRISQSHAAKIPGEDHLQVPERHTILFRRQPGKRDVTRTFPLYDKARFHPDKKDETGRCDVCQAVSVIGRSTQLIMPRSLRPVTSIGWLAPCSRYLVSSGRPLSSSSISWRVTSPDWMSARIRFISALVSALITRGP